MSYRPPEYEDYHKKVVEACVSLMGEANREFFDEENEYADEFAEGVAPDEVARQMQEAAR